MLKAIVFDFDGVIVDSEPMHFRAFARVIEAMGVTISYEEYLERYIGYDDRDLMRVCLEELSVSSQPPDPARMREMIDEKADVFEQILGEGIAMIPGAKSFIDEAAAQMPIAISSGASRQDIDLILNKLSMTQRFGTIVSADDVVRSKPNPQTYRLAVENLAGKHPDLDLQPDECLAIEDTTAGLESARGAGLMTLGLTTTGPASALMQAHRIAENFEGLTLSQLHEWFD